MPALLVNTETTETTKKTQKITVSIDYIQVSKTASFFCTCEFAGK